MAYLTKFHIPFKNCCGERLTGGNVKFFIIIILFLLNLTFMFAVETSGEKFHGDKIQRRK